MHIERTRQDCNWIVTQTAAMRADYLQRRLHGVTGLENRLAIKIEVRAMTHNELRAALAGA
jgi:hypothetical protein